MGYATWLALAAQSEIQVAVSTPTLTLTPSPSSTMTLTPTRTPSPWPTSTMTPTLPPTITATATPEPTNTPVPSPTPTPDVIVWVQTNSDFGLPPHTLGIISSLGENSELQPYAAAPALSPTGQKLAFFSESSLSGLNTGIWIADLVNNLGQNYKQLNDVTDVRHIAWSPDGDKLAFEVILNPQDSREAWQHQIRIARSNPDDDYIELDRFDGRQPTWGPGSQQLVYYNCAGSQCGLFVVNCEGGNCDEKASKQITFDSTDSYPSWATDGSIAFASKRDGDPEIYLWLPGDSAPIQLTNRPSIDTTPVFDPTGRKIYFRTDDPNAQTWHIDVIMLAEDKRTVQDITVLKEDVGADDNWGLVQPTVQ